MNLSDLATTAAALVAPGKGILAADESTGTIKKRFDQIRLESSEATRQAYRQLMFTTPGAADSISGVILYDETIRQRTTGGKPFPQLLAEQGILPGIKVDMGAKPLALSEGEKVTEGLDGLRERLAEYRELGAKFAKWRAVITIGDEIPTHACVHANAEALARYAALCQEAGIVPIVEPEVLMDGSHSIERCSTVTESTLRRVFDSLHQHHVALEGMLLKPNMVISGTEASPRADVAEVAESTLACFARVVPAAVPGIVFLSGGQSDQEATAHLNAMNSMGSQPWALSFSYGRALQHPVLMAWKGKVENLDAAQKAFQHRAKMNGLACRGAYASSMEEELVSA